jgi:tetratricopeptide (TPR) repeat protein
MMTPHEKTHPQAALIAFILLVLNSSYLAARADPSLFYFANVMAHIVLGVGLVIFGARFLLRRWRGLSRGQVGIAGILALGALTGLALMIRGATRPYRWLLHAHIAVAVAGAAVFIVYYLGWRAGRQRKRAIWARRGAAIGLALLPLAALSHGYYVERSDGRIVNPDLPPPTMDGEGDGPASPFFPSSATTTTGKLIPADFFLTSEQCGRCHRDIYDQWYSSAHHFSSFNNQWYRKSVEYMQEVVGTRPSKWCAGCHDHAVFFNGRFDTPIKEQIRTPEAQAGLACTSCHSIVHVKSTMGQGDFVIEYPPLHDLATSENRWLRWAHDYLLKLDPQPHRRTFLRRFHREQSAEFCSACHKVHLDVPVNHYRWIRGFNEYDNWQSSGVSGQGARSFYYPPQPRTCVDCHMPLVPSDDPAAKNGMVRSHRFPGANTALPFANRDYEQLRITEEFLRSRQITVDIFGLVRTGEPARAEAKRWTGEEPRLASTFAVGEESLAYGAGSVSLTPPAEVIAPLDPVPAVVRRGESVRLEVVVRTRGVGHFFPGGTVDAFDVWVELEAVDETGRKIFHSGYVEDEGRGPVDPSAHFYRSLLIDEHGNVINKRNAWAARSVVYVRLIPPGAADTIHYRLKIPEDCGSRITLRARVNYRKFAWWNTQWAFAGVRDPAHKGYSVGPGHDDGQWVFTGDTSGVSGKIKAIPNLPIVVMAEDTVTLDVIDRGAMLPEVKPLLDPSVRERWNDYGIGLLLQGDLKGAEAAFLKVTQMDPTYADGWVNLGRARVQEGNMVEAEKVLRRALEVNPKLASAHFFLAMALKGIGRYDEALEHLRAAAAQYPRDRVVLNQIGRILFLQRKHQEAIAELRKVLAIDPEDVQAHYNLMLCYQGLGQKEQAARHEALYRRFKADEAAQFITGPYRRLNPEDNNERQAIHEHTSSIAETAYRKPSRTRPPEKEIARRKGA